MHQGNVVREMHYAPSLAMERFVRFPNLGGRYSYHKGNDNEWGSKVQVDIDVSSGAGDCPGYIETDLENPRMIRIVMVYIDKGWHYYTDGAQIRIGDTPGCGYDKIGRIQSVTSTYYGHSVHDTIGMGTECNKVGRYICFHSDELSSPQGYLIFNELLIYSCPIVVECPSQSSTSDASLDTCQCNAGFIGPDDRYLHAVCDRQVQDCVRKCSVQHLHSRSIFY